MSLLESERAEKFQGYLADELQHLLTERSN